MVQLAAPPMSAALTALGRPHLSAGANLISGLGLLLMLPPMLFVFGLPGAGAHAVIQASACVALLGFCAWTETAPQTSCRAEASA
jgi:hypothetical protein